MVGAWARLGVLWAALAAVAWATSRGGSGDPARWLGLAAPLALVWSDSTWRRASGPVALGALGRRPAWASLALWLAVSPFALVAPATGRAADPSLTFSAQHLGVASADDRPGLSVRWTAEGAMREADSKPFAGLPPPTPVTDPPTLDPGPWRAAVLLLLAWGLHRRGAEFEDGLGLAGGLSAAAVAFALGEVLPWGLST
jgi:hypothetical protein